MDYALAMMGRTLIFMVAWIFAASASCSPNPRENETPLPAPLRVVSGRVIRDPATAGPAPMVLLAEVVVDHQPAAGTGEPAGYYESVADANGAFEFRNVPPGRYVARLVPAPAGAQPITIEVADKDVAGIELGAAAIAIAGRVEVEGHGLIPHFTVNCGGVAVATDGTPSFTIAVPAGAHRVSIAGLPKGYTVKAIAFGLTNLLEEPLPVVAGTPPPEIVVRLGVDSPPPWSRVSGRVTRGGRPPSLEKGGTQVVLSGITVRDRFATALRADGSFEFSQVIAGQYDVLFNPEFSGFRPMRVTIDQMDINDLAIALPVMKPQVRVRVVVSGGSAPPNFQLIFYDVPFSAAEHTATRHVAIPITADGTFTVELPAGKYPRILPASLPQGYTVKSFTDGAVDLLKTPLSVDGKSDKNLVLTLAKTP